MAGDPALPAPIRAFADALSIHFSDETSRIVAVLVPGERLGRPPSGSPWPVVVVYVGERPDLDLSPWLRDGVVRFGSIPLVVTAEPLSSFEVPGRPATFFVAGTFPDEEGRDAWSALAR